MSNDHSGSKVISANVIDYPARDMTITVAAAMTVGELREVLRQEQQQLPVDTPDDSMTIGEMVAFDISGPRQYGYFTLRDYLIGIEARDGSGRVFHAGGRVVKNVAGYDLCRLLIGAEGKLGKLQQLTFKLNPLPADQHVCVASFRTLKDLEASLETINTTATTPRILDVVNSVAARLLLPAIDSSLTTQSSAMAEAFLIVGFDGSRKACDWQTKAIAEELHGLASGITTIGTPSAVPDYCRTATKFSQFDNDAATGWWTRVVTLPSQVVTILEIANELGVSACGRAGNGIVFLSGDTQIRTEDLRDRLTRLIDTGCGHFQFRKQNFTVQHPVISSQVERYSTMLNELLG